jgi:hypothetical protein
MNVIKKHKFVSGIILGILVGFICTYGYFWATIPEMTTDPNSVKSFDICSSEGFTTFYSAENEMTCVLPNGKHFVFTLR